MTNSNQLDPGSSTPQPPIGYPVSSLKFWLMSILTFNLYTLYWSYKNFRALKVPSDSKIAAAIWSLFFPLSFFSMMEGLEKKAAEFDKPIRTHKWAIAWIYFILITSTKILNNIAEKVENETILLIAFAALSCQLLSLFVISIIQRKTVRLNRELIPQPQIVSRFGAEDFGMIILVVGVFIKFGILI
ncbi:MAG: hypothetical protein KC652_28275 [Cyanobacteria bacterium HKST-UBA01]|nr:hypothetical protein [Cyanobacteria bacterium HKST-UBA01]